MLTSSDFSGLFTPRFFKNFLPAPPWSGFLLGAFPPDFALQDVTYQRTVRLSNYRGKRPVLLNFTRIFTEKQYCPFCFPHILALNQTYSKFQSQGVEILMIASLPTQQGQTVVHDLSLNIPLLCDPGCVSFRRFHTGQALGAPLSAQFILDVQGRLRYRHLFSFLDHNASPETLLGILSKL